MAILPDDTALGPLPSANSGRPIARYDTSSIGAGVAALGKGISSAANDIAYVQVREQAKTDEFDAAKAQSKFLVDNQALRDKLSDETDPSKLDETYAPQFKKVQDDSAALISNPRARELWTLKTNPLVNDHAIAVGNKQFELETAHGIAGAQEQLDQLRNSALKTSDPATRAAFIKTGQQLIGGLKDAGYIDAVTEQKFRTKWTQDYAIGAVSIMPPEEQIRVLSPTIQGRDAILDRIGGVENATGNPAARNPNSSAMGNFQFTNKTWLDTIEAHRPELLQGRSTQAVLELRADAKLSREMAGYLLDDNSAVLRNQGIAPTPSNLYLAHFLGAEAATKVLKAAPGTPVSDIVSPEAIAANKSVLHGKTVDSVIGWSAQKMSGEANAIPKFDGYSLPGKEAALIEYHRDNLRNGTYADNGGDISTVYITGVTGPDGKIYNVPGFWDGKLHKDVKEITDHAAQAGWDKWPSYANGKLADAAAERDHKIVEADTAKFREAKTKRGGGILDFIPEDKRVEMLHTATEQVAANGIDGARRTQLETQQRKDASDARELEVLSDISSANPKMNANSIIEDGKKGILTREAVERLLPKAKAALDDANSKADKTYGHGFYDAYQLVHAPNGTPGKITDPAELYKRVGPKGDLTVAGVDKLVSEIQSKRTPEGEADSAIQKQFFSLAKAKISGQDEGLHIKDPKGEELFAKFLPYAYKAIADGKKNDKSIAQLLTPGSPDYIGKVLDVPGNGFVRPMSQWFSDIVQDSPVHKGEPAAAAFDIKTVKSLDDLVSAYRAGKVTKAQADQMAIDSGWAAKRAPSSPTQAPISGDNSDQPKSDKQSWLETITTGISKVASALNPISSAQADEIPKLMGGDGRSFADQRGPQDDRETRLKPLYDRIPELAKKFSNKPMDEWTPSEIDRFRRTPGFISAARMTLGPITGDK